MARVLVVDDDPTVREVVVSYLRPRGHEVVEAADGESALTIVRDDPADLVVLDLMLPGIDGLEVCRRMRAGRRRPGDHADRARRGDRPGRRPGARRRRLRHQAVQPARAGAAGRVGAAPRRRADASPTRAGSRTATWRSTAPGTRPRLGGRAARPDRPRVRPARFLLPTPASRSPARAAPAGVGLVVRRPVHGHRPRAAAAREDRARPDDARRGSSTVWGVGYRWEAERRDQRPVGDHRHRRRVGGGRRGVVGLVVAYAARRRSSRWQIGVVALIAVLAVVAGVVGTARAMFLSDHDLSVVLWVVVVAGLVSRPRLAVGAAFTRWSRSMREDARRFGESGRSTPARGARRAPAAQRRAGADRPSARGVARPRTAAGGLAPRAGGLGLARPALTARRAARDDRGTRGRPGRRPGPLPPADPRRGRPDGRGWSTTCSSFAHPCRRPAAEPAAGRVRDVVSEALAGADPVARAGGVRLGGNGRRRTFVTRRPGELSRVIANLCQRHPAHPGRRRGRRSRPVRSATRIELRSPTHAAASRATTWLGCSTRAGGGAPARTPTPGSPW